MAFIILQGDALHIPLADESAQCVVTSPPYWGLRDYGTATWDGGAPECDHLDCRGTTRGGKHSTITGGQDASAHVGQYRNICPKCGARRIDKQLGLEPVHDCLGWATGNPCGECYVCHMVAVFREVWRVLRKDGVVWLNLGDSYATGAGKVGDHPGGGAQSERWAGPTTQPNRMPIAGLKPKDLVGIPWRVAFALQADGWWLRSAIVWAKGISFCDTYSGSVMPESVTDRPTKAHEDIFLLTKSERYFYDHEAVKEAAASEPQMRDRNSEGYNTALGTGKPRFSPGTRAYGVDGTRNLRDVWAINPANFKDAHFATFPPALVEPCIKAGTSEKGCCPKCGAPWKRVVERESERHNAGAAKQRIVASGGALDGGTERPTLGGMTRFVQREEVGWQPTCDCPEHTPVPCIVLDPFSGAGTTILVADRLRRHGVGLELKAEYTRMGRDRVFNDAPLLALMGV